MTAGGHPLVESMRASRLSTLADIRSDRLVWMRQMGIREDTIQIQRLDQMMSDEVWRIRVAEALRNGSRRGRKQTRARLKSCYLEMRSKP
jgi:hypothetical protein